MNTACDIIPCSSFKDITERLPAVLEQYSHVFPPDSGANILLKPNLNSNMSALTGNTTDLRILSGIIAYLKDKGYSNITIGEGTNSGFYRNRIGVIARLKVDALARYYGVQVKDLNYAEPFDILFDKGVKASVAMDCVDAALFINVPKLKTHFENGMSVCLKNLMGCLVGQENKKKTHDNLPENILRINDGIKPHLHIVDGLVSMEGLGPTRGTPLRTDVIIVGTDPCYIDLVCARFSGFDYRHVRTLALAEKKGLLTEKHFAALSALDIKRCAKTFKPPKAGPLATFIHSPKRQKFFLRIRNTRFFTYFAATDWFGHLLFKTGLRQDVFLQEEMSCSGLSLDEAKCDQCGVCRDVCPLGRGLPRDLKNPDDRCIKCLYCYSVCPKEAIGFDGEFGFFKEQIRQYDSLIRELYSKKQDEEKIVNQVIIIVSGLPRSGTSMMTKMLQSGGIELLVDNIRKADEDNPKGYFEFEKVKRVKEDSSWLEDAQNKAVKMVSMLLYELPKEKHYKVIFMKRDMGEMLASQRRMLQRLNREPTDNDDKMCKLFAEHLAKVDQWLQQQTHIDVIYVKYKDVVENPKREAERVNQFLCGQLDVKSMVSVLDRSLYRNRA